MNQKKIAIAVALSRLPALRASSTSSRQLSSLDGYSAAVGIPHYEWVHLKMEVMGSQARVFINSFDRPNIRLAFEPKNQPRQQILSFAAARRDEAGRALLAVD